MALFFAHIEKKCIFVAVKRCAYIALFVLSLLGLLGAAGGHRLASATPAESVAAAQVSVSCYSDDCYTQGGCSDALGCSAVASGTNAPTLWRTGKTIDGRCRRFFINHNAISFKAGRMWSCCVLAVYQQPLGLLPVDVKHHAQFFMRLRKLII